MTRLRIPVLLVLFGSACGLLAPDDDYFDGDGRGGSVAASGGNASGGSGGSGSDPTAGSGAMNAGGGAGEAGAGAMSGAVGGSSGGAGAMSGGAGGSSGGAGAGAVSGAAGAAGADCGLPATKAVKEPCGACNTGMRTRTFTLTEACDYVESSLTDCGGVTAACSPGTASPCANGDPCGQRVCSNSCTLGPCEVKGENECLTIGEGHTETGSAYRCCGLGKWQFCLPPTDANPLCRWSTDCVSCSRGAPSFCTDCY